MRRFVTSFILALLIISGSGATFAQNHHRGNDRKEHNSSYRHDKNRPGSGSNNKGNHNRPNVGNDKSHGKDKHHGGNVGNRPGGNRPGGSVGNRPGGNRPGHNNSYGRPGSSGSHHRPHNRPHHHRPTPPPPPPHHHYHHNLGPMIHHAINGAHDVNIWQVDYDTYVVRYRIGNRLYAQYIYPNTGRYGERSLISVNWQPRSPWVAIPPITFNINL